MTNSNISGKLAMLIVIDDIDIEYAGKMRDIIGQLKFTSIEEHKAIGYTRNKKEKAQWKKEVNKQYRRNR